MTENRDPLSNVSNTQATDVLFRRMVIISTALSLAAIYGWLACFDRQSNGDLYFHCRWNGLLWIFIGLGTTLYFWQKIWPPENVPAAARKEIIKGSVALVIPALWWAVFPLRFLSGQHFWDVVIGLAAAVTVLSFGACMVIRLINAFERSDREDLNALQTTDAPAVETAPESKK